MKLKVKFSKWSAGIPGIMLHPKTAELIGTQITGRVSIKTLSKYPRELITVVDTIEKFVKKDEVLISSETKNKLGIKEKDFIDINLAMPPKSLDYIKEKLNGKRLTKRKINRIIADIVNDSLAETEVALFISAMYKQGMNMKEVIYLIKAILKTGNLLKFKQNYLVDKHCIGGVAGNRTTPIVVSICAAAGLYVPKTSSRAITSAAGTADVIEAIANISFNQEQLRKIIRKTNAFIVWGGALSMVPADSKIIKIEKSLKIDPEAQLLASIMAKKIAVGSKYILIDIPYGKTAKIATKKKALHLKEKFEKLGKHFRKKLKCVLTDGSQPIGNGVGPIMELRDIINVLDPNKKGPRDLQDKSIFLASELISLSRKYKKQNSKQIVEEILNSGKAFDKFKEIIEAQGGKIIPLKVSKFSKDILAPRSGKIIEIDNKKINNIARVAGCPADKYAGLYLHKKVKDRIKKGEKIITIYAQSKVRLEKTVDFYSKIKPYTIK